MRIADAYALRRSGAIIEVLEEAVDRAKIILSELGIEVGYDSEKDKFEFIPKIDRLTYHILLY